MVNHAEEALNRLFAPYSRKTCNTAQSCCAHVIDVLPQNDNQEKPNCAVAAIDCRFFYSSLIDKEDEIIPEILFIQFLIRLASPVEKRVDIAFVGVIGLRTE